VGTPGLDDIVNYLELSDRLGTGGQPRPRHFRVLADAGYSVVVNLATPQPGRALPREDWLASQLGMQYVHLPIPWQAPQQAHVDRFLDLMALFGNEKVFVHCIKNMRVSALVYVYRVCRLGVPLRIAESDMLRIWRPDGPWATLVDSALVGACEGLSKSAADPRL